MTAAPQPRDARGRGAAIGWVLSFLRPHAAALSAIALSSLVAVGIGLAQPALTRLLIDDALGGRDAGLLVGLCAGMVGLALFNGLFGAWNRWLYIKVSSRVLFALREDLYGHLLTLSPRFFAGNRRGELLTRLDGDVGEVLRFAVDAPLAAFNAVILLAGALALMAQLSTELTALALLVLPVQFLFLRWMRPIVDRRTRALRERSGDISAFLVETLGMVKLIQAMGAEQDERRRLRHLTDAYSADLLRLQLVNFATGNIPAVLGGFGNALVFIAGGLMVLDGSFTLGALIAFSAYLGRATGPLQALLSLYVGLRRARVSLERVIALRQVRPDVAPPAAPMPIPPPSRRGAITLDGVEFAHDDADPLLRGISLSIAPGSKVVLVGPSGAGKSSLVDLLPRFADPQAGRILLDGCDLRRIDLADLRRQVAVMGQDVQLFAGTIADNIRFGCPAASSAEVERAARAAQLGDLLARLPQGLDSQVGSEGARLSGGERQRIALARCLLRDPLVLVLDEPSSALDDATAADLDAAIDRLFGQRTRIVVTHRPHHHANADAVWRLEEGRLHPLPRRESA